jgi:uncharacterized protein YndB with AHSA1/START domain
MRRAAARGDVVEVCPSDVVNAPADRVWQLVATPIELARWSDTALIGAPDRELRAGDRLVLGAGIAHRMKVIFSVREVRRPEQLHLHIRLPFGVTNDEVIRITPLGANACRVTFN